MPFDLNSLTNFSVPIFFGIATLILNCSLFKLDANICKYTSAPPVPVDSVKKIRFFLELIIIFIAYLIHFTTRNIPLFSSLHLFSSYLSCLLYTSDAADDLLCVDLGGRRIIKKK